MKSVVETYAVATGQVTQVLTADTRIEAPNWSPCGTWLLVNSGGRLFRIPLAAPRLQPIDTGAADRCNNDHGITRDGRWIYLCSHHGGQGAEIYRQPVAGGNLEKISSASPSWWHGFSPDGARICYPGARGGSRVIDIYTMPAGGGLETRLTGGEGQSDGPEFSADGRHIFYNCDRGGHSQIWVMQADGRHQRRLFTDDSVNWFPHPSPDGRHLVYLAYPPGTQGHPADLPVSLVLCTPRGTRRRAIRSFIGGQGTLNVPSWSPDSTAFAYIRYEP